MAEEPRGAESRRRPDGGVHDLKALPLHALPDAGGASQSNGFAVATEEIVDAMRLGLNQAACASNDPLGWQGLSHRPHAKESLRRVIDDTRNTPALELRQRDLLDPRAGLVQDPTSELHNSFIADVDAVVVVQPARNREVITRLEPLLEARRDSRAGRQGEHGISQYGGRGSERWPWSHVFPPCRAGQRRSLQGSAWRAPDARRLADSLTGGSAARDLAP